MRKPTGKLPGDSTKWNRITMEKKARRLAGNAIGQLIHNRYFDLIPLREISQILRNHGFDPDDLNGIYVGREGRIHEQVGPRTFLSLSWYQMPSGRFEITAYLT
jgi:hypothetical protein